MPSIYQLKPAFQNLLRPMVRFLAQIGVTANQVTITAMVLSIITSGVLIWNWDKHWPFFLIPAVLFIRMALNAVDGMLAREHNMKSNLGVFLNELGDVVSDLALYLPFLTLYLNFVFIPPSIPGIPLLIFLFLAVISEMAGILAVAVGRERRYDGPMGKSDRAVWFSAISILIGWEIDPWALGGWIEGVFIIMSFLAVITIINRVRTATGEMKK